jgi:hypothetical protein
VHAFVLKIRYEMDPTAPDLRSIIVSRTKTVFPSPLAPVMRMDDGDVD